MAGLVNQILRGLGAEEVDLTSNGVEAVQRLNRETYDLVICDIAMEAFNGLQLLAAVRAGLTKADKDLPVIMLTGHTDEEMVATAKGLAANGFLGKPMSWNALSNEVERVIFDKTPIKIPSLNKDEIRRGLFEAQNRVGVGNERDDLDDDLQYVGHIYHVGEARQTKVSELGADFSAVADAASRAIEEVAAGDVLAEDVVAGDGRKMLSKGIQLTKAKVKLLRDEGRAFGITHVRVAEEIGSAA